MRKNLYKLCFFSSIVVFVVATGLFINGYLQKQEGENLYVSAQTAFVAFDAPPSPAPAEAADTGTVPAESLTVDFEKLQAINGDIIGWLYIPDTPISYPILQGTDNETYLNTTYDKQKHYFGSIFLDAHNSPDFTDTNTMVYGHNIRGDAMFGSLKKYGDAQYLDNHKQIVIATPAGTLTYTIFAAYPTTTDNPIYTTAAGDLDTQTYLESLVKQYGIAQEDTHIITLSTCEGYNVSNRRFVVHGILAPQ